MPGSLKRAAEKAPCYLGSMEPHLGPQRRPVVPHVPTAFRAANMSAARAAARQGDGWGFVTDRTASFYTQPIDVCAGMLDVVQSRDFEGMSK